MVLESRVSLSLTHKVFSIGFELCLYQNQLIFWLSHQEGFFFFFFYGETEISLHIEIEVQQERWTKERGHQEGDLIVWGLLYLSKKHLVPRVGKKISHALISLPKQKKFVWGQGLEESPPTYYMTIN